MKKTEPNTPKNHAFQRTFKQTANIATERIEFQEEVLSIREALRIPKNGFIDLQELMIWLDRQEKNKFVLAIKAFKNHKHISAKPTYFLKDLAYKIKNDDIPYPDDLFFFRDVRHFKAILNEKPFPGIVNYVLVNEVLVPETNQLQLTMDEFEFPILRIGPNSTMNDIRELWPIITGLLQNKKGKTRYKRTRDRNKKIASLTPDGGRGYNVMYDAIDILAGKDHNTSNKKDDKRHMANIRKIKSRNKN